MGLSCAQNAQQPLRETTRFHVRALGREKSNDGGREGPFFVLDIFSPMTKNSRRRRGSYPTPASLFEESIGIIEEQRTALLLRPIDVAEDISPRKRRGLLFLLLSMRFASPGVSWRRARGEETAKSQSFFLSLSINSLIDADVLPTKAAELVEVDLEKTCNRALSGPRAPSPSATRPRVVASARKLKGEVLLRRAV